VIRVTAAKSLEKYDQKQGIEVVSKTSGESIAGRSGTGWNSPFQRFRRYKSEARHAS